MKNNRIDILMATFNGALFVDEQLNSIATQTHKNWRLIVRDDGSTDDTPVMLRAFEKGHPGQVILLDDGLGNLGPSHNFGTLLTVSDAPYVALSDQDDIWLHDKLEKSLERLLEMRAQYPRRPLMVFSDRRILNIADPASELHWAPLEGLSLEVGQSFKQTLFMNAVPGCTILMNRALVDLVGRIPQQAKTHDHWITLVATQFGHVGLMKEPLVRWRKHETNVTGIRKEHANNYFARAWKLFSQLDIHKHRYFQLYEQISCFRLLYSDKLSAEQLKHIDHILMLQGKAAPLRFISAVRLGVLPWGWARKLGFWIAGAGIKARQMSHLPDPGANT